MTRTTVGIFAGFVIIAGALLIFGGEATPPNPAADGVPVSAADQMADLKTRAEREKQRSWWQQNSGIDPDMLDDREPEHMRDGVVVPVPELVAAERSLDVDAGAGDLPEVDPAALDRPRQEVRFPETRRVASLGPQEADPRFGTDEDVSYESQADTEFAADSFAEIPNAGDVTAAAGSIAFWLQPNWSTDQPHEGSLVALAEGRLRLEKASDSLRFEFTNAAGSDGGIGAEIYEWQPGEWHYVLGTWKGNVMTLFVDGEQIAQGIRDGDLEIPERPRLSVGSSPGGDVSPPPGVIKDIRVYKRAISPDEVNTHFRRLAAQAPVDTDAKD